MGPIAISYHLYTTWPSNSQRGRAQGRGSHQRCLPEGARCLRGRRAPFGSSASWIAPCSCLEQRKRSRVPPMRPVWRVVGCAGGALRVLCAACPDCVHTHCGSEPPHAAPLAHSQVQRASLQVCQASKSQKGRWRSIDAGQDASDDQVGCVVGGWFGGVVVVCGGCWKASALLCSARDGRAQCDQPTSRRWSVDRGSRPMQTGGSSHHCRLLTHLPPPPLAPLPQPQQDISRGREMVDSLFQGGQGEAHTFRAENI